MNSGEYNLHADKKIIAVKSVQYGNKVRPSIKPGTWNIPEHAGTFRNIPEHEKIKIIFMKKNIMK